MAELAVRSEIAQAHDTLLAHWSAPGAWWSANERRAIAAETRLARSHREVGPLASPAGDPSLSTGPFADAVIDAIWRIANHPGTLSPAWYSSLIRTGLSPLAYVEMLGIVAMAVCLDSFDRAIGRDPRAVPASTGGESTQAMPEGIVIDVAESDSHWVPTTDFDGPNVRKALSGSPGELFMQGVVLDAQYVPGGATAVPLDQSVWSLDRVQMELVATRVSTMNECFY